MGAIAQEYINDREKHDKTAAEWTRRYAQYVARAAGHRFALVRHAPRLTCSGCIARLLPPGAGTELYGDACLLAGVENSRHTSDDGFSTKQRPHKRGPIVITPGDGTHIHARRAPEAPSPSDVKRSTSTDSGWAARVSSCAYSSAIVAIL